MMSKYVTTGLAVLTVLIALVFLSPATGKEPAASDKIKVDGRTSLAITYYMDVREYNTANILLNSTRLPLGWSLFGFTDFHSSQRVGSRLDFTRHFMEYRLRRSIDPQWLLGLSGLAIEFEYNDFDGPGNQTLRIGATFRHVLPTPLAQQSWLMWRAHPYESDNSGWQASVIWFFGISARFYISGFADYNVNKGNRNRWISEPQLNFVFNRNFDIVIEGRYNGFEKANPDLDGTGVTLGLKAKF